MIHYSQNRLDWKICPEGFSKPVLRILGNVVKSRNKNKQNNHRKLTICFACKQTETKVVYKRKKNLKKSESISLTTFN